MRTERKVLYHTDDCEVNTESCETENKISSRLKILLGDMNVSEFARKCGTSQQVMDRYINRGFEPKIRQLMLICQRCGCTADWLIGLSDERNPPRPTHHMSSSEQMTDIKNKADAARSAVNELLKSLDKLNERK